MLLMNPCNKSGKRRARDASTHARGSEPTPHHELLRINQKAEISEKWERRVGRHAPLLKQTVSS